MKLDIIEIETLKNLPKIIKNYIMEIPEDLLDIRRNSDTWTIREHVYHIVGVQKMLLERMKKIKTDEHPVIEPYFPENDDDTLSKYESLDDAFEKYFEYRKLQTGFLQNLDHDSVKKPAEHKEYTAYSIPIIVKHMIFHEYWHMYRIEEIWLTRDGYFS